MDENNRNFLMAIILSVAVLLAWQAFYNGPKQRELEAQREKQAQVEQTTKAAQPSGSERPKPDAAGAPPVPSATPGAPTIAPAPPGADRKSAISASKRISIETPKLRGSIALTGARIDDLTLTRYRVQVSP